jgi:hypothetical protein
MRLVGPGGFQARSKPLNGRTAAPNADGSVTVVLSRGMTSHPNSLTTLDHSRGNLAFRWFLADEVPTRPRVRLVKASGAPTNVEWPSILSASPLDGDVLAKQDRADGVDLGVDQRQQRIGAERCRDHPAEILSGLERAKRARSEADPGPVGDVDDLENPE